MSCETHFESRNSKNSGSLATPLGIQTTNLSGRSSSLNQLSGLLATSESKHYRLNSPHVDYNADSDHARITMKTRVTVRDKTPHRFQVVPLRDVSKPAALESGRPSQLALPLASHTLLRSASIRRQTCSQVRPNIASSYSQVDLKTQANYNVVMLAENLATPCVEMFTMPGLALSPSFELDNLGGSHPLVEQDINRQCTKSTIHEFECSITAPTNAPQSYDASHHAHVQKPVALFSIRSPSVHTTSQSLDLVSCDSGTYSKIPQGNIPEHLIATTQSPTKGLRSPRKKRTRSENIPSIRNKNQRDGRNVPAALVVKEGCDSRMTKRHAIYTQSLYVPFLETPSYLPGSSTKNRDGRHQLFEVHPNGNTCDSHKTHQERVSFSQLSHTFISDSEVTLRNTNPGDQSSPPTGLQDVGEAAASEQSLQLLNFRASPTTPHTGPLNYRRLSRVYPLSAEAVLHGKIVYPQIVREMFADIDRAILEWRYI